MEVNQTRVSELAECIPNFSEGQDPQLLELLKQSMLSSEASLLDHNHDPDHNRSVFTLAGKLADIEKAVIESAAIAVDQIDLRKHRGVHPRIGAIDVVPIVPLDGCSMESCVATAQAIGKQVWQQLKLPVYFYGYAAKSRERQQLQTVRKFGFEMLAVIVERNELLPDVGGPSLHPTAGACCIGVRQFMIAFNIQLADKDDQVAKRIAGEIRESSGGLSGVKALGFYIKSKQQAQVSINLTRLEETSLHQVFNKVREEARKYSVQVLGSELIGLAPHKALLPGGGRTLGIAGFHPGMVLENCLQKAKVSGRTTESPDPNDPMQCGKRESE